MFFMKTKKLTALCMALVMTSVSAVSVYAAEITNENPNGQTEVIAKINGVQPGNVKYTIEIPDVVDFGDLSVPADTTVDNFKDVNFTLKLTELEGLDPDSQKIQVYVRDQDATVDDYKDFTITNKSNSSVSFNYDVYNVSGNAFNPDTSINVDRGNMSSSAGFLYTQFSNLNEEVTGTLRLDQNQLAEYNLENIVGDYSGYMVFYSKITSV